MGNANDATVFTCIRLIPNGAYYKRKVVYIETMEGAHPMYQAIRLKQLFEDFQASYVAMDCMGASMSLYDECCKLLYDEERDKEYCGWASFNDEEMRARALTPNPLEVVFSIKASSKFNHEMSSKLRVDLQQSNIELLVNEMEGKEFLSDKNEYINASPERRARIEMPYLQTTALMNELVNLEYRVVGGYIKVEEGSGKRKDRYSSLGYANYLATILEKELSDEDIDIDDDDIVYF